MKPSTLCTLTTLVVCLFAKVFFEKDKVGTRHLPKNLKPLEASYESKSLQRYAFGYESLLSALLWVQVLQKSSHEKLTSEQEVSWEFAQIDALTTLDPRFDQGYAYGAVFLSVLRRDKLGGRLILEKWAKRYPTYWRPVHMLGMHYYEELGDYASAAPYILRASNMARAPKWINSLGLRLLSDSGSLIHAITTAAEMSKITRDPETLYNLTLRIRSLSYNIQKKEFEARYQKKKTAEPAERSLASLGLMDQEEIPFQVKDALEERFQFRWDPKENRAFPLDPSLETILGKTGVYVPPAAAKRTK